MSERGLGHEGDRPGSDRYTTAAGQARYQLDAAGRVVGVNDAFTALTGWNRESLVGEAGAVVVTEADRNRYETTLDELRSGDSLTQAHLDVTLTSPENESVAVTIRLTRLVGDATVLGEVTPQEARPGTERLDRVNTIIRKIDQALIGAESRDDIECAVCECLVDADPYQFAWIGRIQQTGQTVMPTAKAGETRRYLDDGGVHTNKPPSGQGLASEAARTHEIQVRQHSPDGPSFEPALAAETSFQSVAAVPLVYAETLYGVLLVYADEPFSLGEMEQAVLSELGETIGHAISGLQAKRALVSERVTEVTFDVKNDTFLFTITDRLDCTVDFDGGVFQSDGELVYYFTIEGADPGRVRELAAESSADTLRIVSEDDDVCVLEFHAPSPSLLEAISDHGGTIRTGTISDGSGTIVIELPGASDVQELRTTLRDRFDEVSLVSQRETEQSVQTRHQFRDELIETLTDRQQAALELAYYAAYFDWPRGSTGEELAETLGVSPPTFHKHLRLAERTVIGAILDPE